MLLPHDSSGVTRLRHAPEKAGGANLRLYNGRSETNPASSGFLPEREHTGATQSGYLARSFTTTAPRPAVDSVNRSHADTPSADARVHPTYCLPLEYVTRCR